MTSASTQRRREFITGTVLLLLALAISALVYFPLTSNYFYGDDFIHQYEFYNSSTLLFLLRPHGGHLYLGRNTVYYVLNHLFGTEPSPHYVVVLLTHLVNVWLLFRVVRTLTESALLASFAAAIWGTSPFNEGSLGTYSVFGHVLVGTALLLILDQATRLAAQQQWPTGRRRVLWLALALFSATSFGTGLAAAIVLPFVLLLLLQGDRRRSWREAPLLPLTVILPVMYVTWMYEFPSAENVLSGGTYGGLTHDWTAAAAFCLRLAALGLKRLLVGFAVPLGEFSSPGYPLLAALLIACVLVGWRSPPHIRRQLVAFAVLGFASYAVIAVGRGWFLFPLSVDVLERFSRYHYVGQLMATILICIVLARLAASRRVQRLGAVALGAWYVFALASYVAVAEPIDHHEQTHREAVAFLGALREEIRAAPPGSTVYIENRTFLHMEVPGWMFPGAIGAFVIYFPENTVDGRRVYFVERRPGVFDYLAHGKRTASLVVKSPAPPAGMVPTNGRFDR